MKGKKTHVGPAGQLLLGQGGRRPTLDLTPRLGRLPVALCLTDGHLPPDGVLAEGDEVTNVELGRPYAVDRLGGVPDVHVDALGGRPRDAPRLGGRHALQRLLLGPVVGCEALERLRLR